MFKIKEIWEMSKENMNKILKKNKIHISKNITKNKIQICILYNSQKLIINDDIKYIEDKNFENNITDDFDEFINMFNFSEKPEDVIKHFYKKMPVKNDLNMLLNITENEIMTDYNLYLSKSLIENYKDVKYLHYLYFIFTIIKNKKIITKIYEIILKSPTEIKNLYVLFNNNCNKEIRSILIDIIIFYYKSDYKSNYLLSYQNEIDLLKTIKKYFIYIKTYGIIMDMQDICNVHDSLFDYLTIMSYTKYDKKLLKTIFNTLKPNFIKKYNIFKYYNEHEKNDLIIKYDCKEIFIIINAICRNLVIFDTYLMNDLFELFMFILNPQYPHPKLDVLEIFETDSLYIKSNKNNKNCILKNIIKFLIYNESTETFFLNLTKFIIYGDDSSNLTYSQKLYERGVNVHHNDRDSKTNEAIDILIEQTSFLDHEKYYKKFIKYIENIEEVKRQIVQKVLFGENRTSKDFEGFFEKDVVYENFSGKEIIAKFWYFIKKYENKKENLEDSFVNAILESYQDDNVVCNPGKIQRMVSRILQGRLEDKCGIKINIDFTEKKLKENKQITDYYEIQKILVPFINMYLYEESTRIKNWYDFIIKLFEFIKDMDNEGIFLSYKCTLYYVCFISNTNDLKVNPELSIMSVFDFEL